MDKPVRKTHPMRTVLLILLILILLVLSSPFLYDLIGGYKDYDDIPELISSADSIELTVRKDGVVCFDADKTAVYAYASEEEIADRVMDKLDGLPFVSRQTVDLKKFGYSLNGDSFSASVKLRLFGFLPVQLHADAEATFTPDELEVRLTGLKYGKWISIPYEKYADSFDLPELAEGFVIDTSDFYGELYPLSISTGDDIIAFQCDILNQAIRNVEVSGGSFANLMPVFLNTDSDAARVLRGESSGIYASITDSAALSDLLTGLMKFTTVENAAAFKASLEDAPFLGLKLGDVSSTYTVQISMILSDYETSLTALRDIYKQKHLRITETGFCKSDGSAAEATLPENWGAKIVLQYNRDYNSIVKANDGIYNPQLGAWTVLPNPELSSLPKVKGVSLPKVSGITIFDLTLAIRLPNGEPAIIFLTATDDFGVNVISEDLYKEILAGGALPCYCSSDIIAPNQYQFTTTEEAQRDLVIYLP